MEYKALKEKYNNHQKSLEGNMKNTNENQNPNKINIGNR